MVTTFWDIGSNVGVFSVAAAAMSKTENNLAFEPDTFLVEVIKSSRRLNGMKNVHVIPMAVSASDGFAEFQIAARRGASDSLSTAGGRSQMGVIRDSFMVPTLSGESIGKHLGFMPSFIKIDVEGAEMMVLQGLYEVLKKAKPLVYVELGSETKVEATNLLSELGYFLDAPDADKPLSYNHLFKPDR